MINGLGVLGWGVGGLDAESVALGKPLVMNVPEVVGLELRGRMSDDVTATDLALKVVEVLREADVMGCFVEVFGSGYRSLTVPDRATVANMAPEYGATCVYCPIDQQVLSYLRQTGRPSELIEKIGLWARAQGLWDAARTRDAIVYDRVISIDVSAIGRSVSGPSRPEQRMDLVVAPKKLKSSRGDDRHPVEGRQFDLGNDDVVIAAITSCTNTANPHNMITAGLLARNAVARGLLSKPWVKTSFAPGSRVVASYLRGSGLQTSLD